MKTRFTIILLALFSIQFSAVGQIKYTSSFCEMLGMLDEYISRFDFVSGVPNDNEVERFYPGEKSVSDHFLSLIGNYEKETSTNFNIIKKLGPQGHLYLYSKSLSSLINSLYIYDSRNLASLKKEYILGLPDSLKFAYLKGVYERYGYGNEISIANGINKIKTVALIMESLSINKIEIYNSGPGSVPMDYVLTFESSLKLREQIGYKDSESKLKYYPNKRIVNYK